jgi:hypothetical protein
MRDDGTFNPFAPVDPPRDEELAALLRQAVGDVPTGAVDWDALATRIARALPTRPGLTWWSYAERWSRRIVPIAVAAALVGAVTLWNASDASAVVVAQVAPADVVADVVQGVPVEDAARTFSRTMTAEDVLTAPESE